MTAKRCFNGKIATGKVSDRAGRKLLDRIDQLYRRYRETMDDATAARQAAIDAAAEAKMAAARQRRLINLTVVAQANILKGVKEYERVITGLRPQGKAPVQLRKSYRATTYAALSAFLARDGHEIAGWANVDKLAQGIRGRAHQRFAEAIDLMRDKTLGFRSEAAAELDTLRALYGRTDGAPAARQAADAFERLQGWLADQYIAAGGALAKRKTWRLPNPDIDPAKVAALDRSGGAFKDFIRGRLDRSEMLDYRTGKPFEDDAFEALLDQVTESFLARHIEGEPSAAFRGRPMLANSRDAARVLVWKSADDWMAVAENFGTHASPFDTMMGHIAAMSRDIALLRVMGPNPEATLRYMLDFFPRDPARLATDAAETGSVRRAVIVNRRIETAARKDARALVNLYDEVTGRNRVPVSPQLAKAAGDMRSLLVGAQMGSAVISSLTDTATVAMAARFNGLPANRVLARATAMMAQPGQEIFAAQQGLIADSIAHTIGLDDRIMGDVVRSGTVAKIGSAVIRASGLRRWTAVIRAAFALEMMAHAARERGKGFAALDADFRDALARHGITAADWELIRAAEPDEPRPGALLTRPSDLIDSDDPAARAAGEKFERLINTEMDHAVIDRDPRTRAWLVGDSRPGTLAGEVRSAFGMYRFFPTAIMAMQFQRAFARGFDGKRLTHGALTFIAMSMLGALAMQAKQVIAGRDPRNLDPTEADGLRGWGAAILQGGGLGVFGDMLFADKTRFGNTWATMLAGPQFSATEAILGDFIFGNIQKALSGEETNFLGDALYVASRYAPGSNIWYAKLALQRGVFDQLQLMVDPKARDRFARIERNSAQKYGQDYWWRPGRAEPTRAPELAALGGR